MSICKSLVIIFDGLIQKWTCEIGFHEAFFTVSTYEESRLENWPKNFTMLLNIRDAIRRGWMSKQFYRSLE